MIRKEEIGRRIKKLRMKRGLSVNDLGKILGISPAAVSYYETGQRTPRDKIKVRFAKFFDVDIKDFFFTEEITNDDWK